jgi:hypothetical protein
MRDIEMDIKKIKNDMEKGRNQALQQLAGKRAEVNAINDELHWLDNAPLPLEDALSAIDQFIKTYDHDSSRAKPFFYQHPLAEPGAFKVSFQLDSGKSLAQDGRVWGAGIVDLAGLMIPLLGASTVQRMLHDMAKHEAENIESGPPLAERPELKASLEKRKYALEVEEEALICAAEELGMDGFYRRADVNPEVVLMMD